MVIALKDLMRLRTTLRAQTTKLINSVTRSEIENADNTTLKFELGRTDKLLSRLRNVDEDIRKEIISSLTDDELDKLEIENSSYQDKLDFLRCQLLSQQETVKSNNSIQSSNVLGESHAINRTRLRLPDLSLPEFSADVAIDNVSCAHFFSQLEHMTDCYKLNDTEMFSILASQCRGRAKAMIESLTLLKRKYAIAKTILMSSFAEETPLKFAVIKSLIDLKLKAGDDPYLYYAKYSKLISEVGEHKIDVDTILQYFIWSGLNTEFQDVLVNITQESYPNLQTINNKFTKASGRYNAHHKNDKKYSTNVEIASNATSLKISNRLNKKSNSNISTSGSNKNTKSSITKQNLCILCKNNTHQIARCDTFPTPYEKREKLKSMGICFKCLNSNHDFSKCNYVTSSPCIRCNKSHWTFLCLYTAKNKKNVNAQTIAIPVTLDEVTNAQSTSSDS